MKKTHLQNTNDQIFYGMLKFADETEKTYRSFIETCSELYPEEKFQISDYGVYKARLITCLLIGCGGYYNKYSLGLIGRNNMNNEVQLATEIAYKPFHNSTSNNQLDFENLSLKTEKLIVYLVESLNDDMEDIRSSVISPNETYFLNIIKLFQNAIFESVEHKETMEKLLITENFHFHNLTRKNLMLMSEYMNN